MSFSVALAAVSDVVPGRLSEIEEVADGGEHRITLEQEALTSLTNFSPSILFSRKFCFRNSWPNSKAVCYLSILMERIDLDFTLGSRLL
jgi:hypothetical protein